MLGFLANFYVWVLSFHVISLIAWMAGLFYLPRLYVYHTEQVETGSETDVLFQTMERKLFKLIMDPSMIATFVFGVLLAVTPGIVDWTAGWPYLKIVGIAGMTWFHHWCGTRRKAFVAGQNDKTGRHYRLMNEVPTLMLVLIVVSVIVKPFA
jgi:putative membrane protein